MTTTRPTNEYEKSLVELGLALVKAGNMSDLLHVLHAGGWEPAYERRRGEAIYRVIALARTAVAPKPCKGIRAELRATLAEYDQARDIVEAWTDLCSAVQNGSSS